MNYNFKTPEELHIIKAEVESRIRKIETIRKRTSLLLEEIKTKEKAKENQDRNKKIKNKTAYAKNNIPNSSSNLISRDKRQLEKLQQYENEELAQEQKELRFINVRLNSLETTQQQQGAQRIKVTIVFSALLLIILSLFAIVSLNPGFSEISGASAHSNLTEIGSQDLQTLPEVPSENSAQLENSNQQENPPKEPNSILTSLSIFLHRFFSGSASGTSTSLTGAAIGTLPIKEPALEETICTKVTVCKNESVVSCINVSTSPLTLPSTPPLTPPSIPECIPTCINETTETCQEECLPVCQEEKINGVVREVCISECSVICKPETVETCSESCLQILDETTNKNETTNNSESYTNNNICTTEIVEKCNTEEICKTVTVNETIPVEMPLTEPVVEEMPAIVSPVEEMPIIESPAEEMSVIVSPVKETPAEIVVNETIATENITTEKNGSVKDKSGAMSIESFLGITAVISAGNAYYTVTNISGTYNEAGAVTSCNTAAGTLLNGNGDDGIYQASLGFAFPYFNQVKPVTNSSGDPTPIYMDTNGRLSWNDITSDFGPSDSEMQSEQNIAGLWQDLGADATNNEYICTNQGSAPNRYAVFRWDSAYYNNDGTVQVETVLFENGTIYIQFGNVAAHTEAEPSISGVSLGDNANYRFNSSTTIDGTVLANNSLYIYTRNNRPTLNDLKINSTNPARNDTFRNLTANASVSDTNGDTVKVIYNWLRNSTSLAILNMPFEGINNTAFNNAWDYSGKQNNGSEQGGALWNYSGGHDYRGAYEFNGTTSYISIKNNESLNLSTAFTFSIWIKPKSLKASQYLFGKAYNGDAFYDPPAISLSVSDASLRWTVGGAGGTRVTASGAIVVDDWNHIAATYDGINAKIYINGTLKASAVETSVPDKTPIDLAIGRRGDIADDAAQVFNGTIDDFVIYNRTLSAEQIWNIYQNRTDKLDDNETIRADIWSVEGTPNDGWYDGAMLTSNSLTILNALPTHSTPILNTTNLATNNTNTNLTAYNVSTADADNDRVRNIYNWFANGKSLTILNMPFEGINGTAANNSLDYSGYGNNGKASGTDIVWNATGGLDGKGAYEFNKNQGTGYMEMGASSKYFPTTNQSITFSLRFNANDCHVNAGVNYFLGIMNIYGVTMGDKVGSQCTIRYTDGTLTTIQPTININQWYHYVATFNGSYWSNYIDGVPVTSGDRVGRLLAGSSTSLIIGALRSTSNYFNGTIDEVMIFNRSLSKEQVWNLYVNKTNQIAYPETLKGEYWNVSITPNDGSHDGNTLFSNTLLLLNALPTHSTPILNTTNLATNNTDVNLTAYNVSTADADNDQVRNIYNWFANGTSLTVLNMPFEGINGTTTNNSWDYSGYGNHGKDTGDGLVWNATGGYDGKGSYMFNNSIKYIQIADSNSLDFAGTGQPFSVSMWILHHCPTCGAASYDTALTKGLSGECLHNYALSFQTTTGFFGFGISNSSGCSAQQYAYTPTDAIQPDVWYHVVGMYNGTNLIYYQNGVLKTSLVATTIPASNTGALRLGWGHDTQLWNGSIDEVLIFNRSLSKEQVWNLYVNKTSQIAYPETGARGEYWNVSITPNDGSHDGNTSFSNTLLLLNTPPTQGTPILNTTNLATNDTNTNLTAYNVSTADADNDLVKNIYNWQVNGKSLTVLNMPFEGINGTATNNSIDYSGYGNNGKASGTDIVWNATGGLDGKGAYEFNKDQGTGYMEMGASSKYFPTTNQSITFSLWFNANDCHPNAGVNYFLSVFNIYSITMGDRVGNQCAIIYTDGTSTRIQPAININQWYHYVATFNGSYWSNYIDGVPVTSGDRIGRLLAGTSTSLTIGAWRSTSNYFNGTIDEVQIFNRSLSKEQVWNLYANKSNQIAYPETGARGEYWNVSITPNDGSHDGNALFSNTLLLLNTPPTQGTPILNTTNLATNNTDTNLTAYNVSTADADNDQVRNIYNWQVDGKPIAVLNMPFEGINGTATNNSWDYSGYKNNGKDAGDGLVWNATGGYDGKGAYEFDGINDYIDVDSLDSYPNGKSYLTLSAWVKFTASQTNKQIVGWWYNQNNMLKVENSKVYFYVDADDALGSSFAYSNSALNDGLWHHVVGVYDKNGGSNNVLLYVDGIVQAVKDTTTGTIVSTSKFNIGSINDLATGTYNFNGTIDEVQIFNRSLSADQVWNIYMNRSDEIAYTETATGEYWNVSITPNDGLEDGIGSYSNTVKIKDIAAPTFSNAKNGSANFRYGQNFTANITISNYELDHYILATNASGIWSNLTNLSIEGVTYAASSSVNITATQGNHICWYYWANDTTGNTGMSDYYCFNVVNTPPTQETPILNTTNPATNDTNVNLTAYNVSTTDADNDQVRNIYNWQADGKPIAVLNMPFEGINGTAANNAWDYSGYGNNGSEQNGVLWNATGGFDGKGAYEFDGTNDFINIPDTSNPELNFSYNDFSISLWAKLEYNSSTCIWAGLISKGNPINSVNGWAISMYTGKQNLSFRILESGTLYWIEPVGNLGDLQWHHIVAVRNNTGTGEFLRLYQDGVSVGTYTGASNLNVSVKNSLAIGYGYSYFNGTIDDVLIFNRSLSAEQVWNLYVNKTSQMAYPETATGEYWNVSITPNDGLEDGIGSYSNTVKIRDIIAPTFSNAINGSANFRYGQNFTANITITNYNLDHYILATNASGIWSNLTNLSIEGATYAANSSVNITVTQGKQVCWYYWANDTTGNTGMSSIYCFNVVNTVPTQGIPILNTTNLATNDTNTNLTAYNVSTADADNDQVKNIYNWFANGKSLTLLNMPFEGINSTVTNNAWDYSGYENNGTEKNGVLWNATGGFDGKGAYEFDGTNDFINIPDTSNPELNFSYNDFSISLWAKLEYNSSTSIWAGLISKGNPIAGINGWAISMYTGKQNLSFRILESGTLYWIEPVGNLGDLQWHHIVAVRNNTGPGEFLRLYQDGVSVGTYTGVSNINVSVKNSLAIGYGYAYFNGTIDEVQIFNRSLSKEQVWNLYANKTSQMAYPETATGEYWNVSITPNDGLEDGIGSYSNTVLILNTLPPAPVITAPINGSTTTNRTLALIWNTSIDPDGDMISYNLEIDDNKLFNNVEVNATSITTTTAGNVTYPITTELNVDTLYYWRVKANDSSGYGDYSEVGNFTVQSYLAFSLPISVVAFGSLLPGAVENTTDNTPPPFQGENIGNIFLNVSINGTRYFSSASINASNYMYKIRANESGSFNTSISTMSYVNMSSINVSVNVADLNWRDIHDDFLMDLNLTVPTDEPPGVKSSTITFTIWG